MITALALLALPPVHAAKGGSEVAMEELSLAVEADFGDIQITLDEDAITLSHDGDELASVIGGVVMINGFYNKGNNAAGLVGFGTFQVSYAADTDTLSFDGGNGDLAFEVREQVAFYYNKITFSASSDGVTVEDEEGTVLYETTEWGSTALETGIIAIELDAGISRSTVQDVAVDSLTLGEGTVVQLDGTSMATVTVVGPVQTMLLADADVGNLHVESASVGTLVVQDSAVDSITTDGKGTIDHVVGGTSKVRAEASSIE